MSANALDHSPLKIVDLRTAASHIKQACTDPPHQWPFFFLVGAGISHPPIPLAAEMEEHCKRKANQLGRVGGPPTQNRIDSYSHWFSHAYPHPRQRRDYLKGLMKDAPISHASLRLAHLMISRTISNVVVTTNFDDFVSRALSLFGEKPIVCDHPQTVDRIDQTQDEIQIVHVHGTYWFYDCCNLTGEIKQRATEQHMSSLLDSIMAQRTPIVLGYSGWENDLFMRVLERRLSRPMPYNAFWFLYKRAELDSLPEWLRSNPSVCFVTPEAITETTDPSQVGNQLSGGEPVLPATRVLDELIQEFNLPAPELTVDPLRFLAAQLRGSLPLNVDFRGGGADKYLIGNVVDRLERARELEATALAAEQSTDKVVDAVRRSQFAEALTLAKSVDAANMNGRQLKVLIRALMSIGGNLLTDNNELAAEGLGMALSLSRLAVDRNQVDESVLHLLARIQLARGRALVAIGRYTEALVDTTEALKWVSPSDPDYDPIVLEAAVDRCYALYHLGRYDEYVALSRSVEQRFGDSGDTNVLEDVLKVLFLWSAGQAAAGHYEHCIELSDRALSRYGSLTSTQLTRWLVAILDTKALALMKFGRWQAAAQVCDDIIDKLGEHEPGSAAEIANTLLSKARALFSGGDLDAALLTCDQLISRFQGSAHPPVIDYVAESLLIKASALMGLGRLVQALKVGDTLVLRFQDSDRPALRRLVAESLMTKSMLMSHLEPDSALSIYKRVTQDYANAADPSHLQRLQQALIDVGLNPDA